MIAEDNSKRNAPRHQRLNDLIDCSANFLDRGSNPFACDVVSCEYDEIRPLLIERSVDEIEHPLIRLISILRVGDHHNFEFAVLMELQCGALFRGAHRGRGGHRRHDGGQQAQRHHDRNNFLLQCSCPPSLFKNR